MHQTVSIDIMRLQNDCRLFSAPHDHFSFHLLHTFWSTNAEEDILRKANKFLLKENFKNFGKYALNKGPVSWNGKSYGELRGAALDDQMVIIEMTTLQGFLNSNKQDYVKKHGEKAWNDLRDGLNGLFTRVLAKRGSPAASRYAQAEFKKKYGEDAVFDFMNLDHRICHGQKMAEYLRTESKKRNKN